MTTEQNKRQHPVVAGSPPVHLYGLAPEYFDGVWARCLRHRAFALRVEPQASRPFGLQSLAWRTVMPTGYTADIANGKITELEPFVWQLARGMGALVTMRDEPWDAPVPERLEPSDYHTKKLADLTTERERIYRLGEAAIATEIATELAEYESGRDKRKTKQAEHRQRYLAMIEKVEAWTDAPEGIKEFGLEQLRSGLDFDCPEPFKDWGDEPMRDPAAWKIAKLEKVNRDIEYHSVEDAKERVRTDARNAWLTQLRRSLARDTDGSPQGTDAQRQDGEAATAGAAGIARTLPEGTPS